MSDLAAPWQSGGTRKLRMLDLFCGRFGWGKAFVARGWQVLGVDLIRPPEIPAGCEFASLDILGVSFAADRFWHRGTNGAYRPPEFLARPFDFICASSPCEEFSVHGMKHFHPNPKYPEMGIKLFNHTRALCEASGLPYVMENVRAAQQFVGQAEHHCDPFYLWGNAVPPLMPQGIKKGMALATGYAGFSGRFALLTKEQKRAARKADPMLWSSSRSPERKAATAAAATIPPELAGAVADYATRLCEVTA